MSKKLFTSICFCLMAVLSGCKKEEKTISFSSKATISSQCDVTVSDEVSSKIHIPSVNEVWDDNRITTDIYSSKEKTEIEKTEEVYNSYYESNVEENKPIESDYEEIYEDKADEVFGESTSMVEDEKDIEEIIVECINTYRINQGEVPVFVLKGLTEYAEYRSEQLVSNFSHDTYDERAAATDLKYGRFIEPWLYGMTGEAYYTACCAEAIVKVGVDGTNDDIAQTIASLVYNSDAHWSYVGKKENKFIGVGVTYESGIWYCDIAVSEIDYG